MWLVEGNFDLPNDQTKFKLLRPGRTYPLGRKAKQPLQLVISNPKVSSEHVSFAVGPCSVDDVNDPLFKPSLTLVNHRTKPIQLIKTASGERLIVNPSSALLLAGGESIALVTGVYVNVHWRPMCCFAPPKTPLPPFEHCSSLGVKVVSTAGPEVTHHLTQSLEGTAAVAISILCSAELVLPQWLQEVIRLGTTAEDANRPSELEQEFKLPDASQYRPKQSQDLPSLLKVTDAWTVNESRKNIFKGWRFLFACKKGEVDAETRRLVELAGGEYECFDVSGGASRWEQSLSRNKRKAEADGEKGLAVVGDEDALRIELEDASEPFFKALRKSSLRLIGHSQLTKSVLLCDATLVDSSKGVQIGPDGVEPEPPTSEAPPVNRRKLPPRRVASRETTPSFAVPSGSGSVAQSESVKPPSSRASAEPESSTQRRRPLIKRTIAKDLILGVDDPSIPDIPESQIPKAGTKPTAASEKPPSNDFSRSRSSLLKRRVGTNSGPSTGMDEVLAIMNVDPQNEPPLKKFRALFEETDPDRVNSQMSGNILSGTIPLSQFSTERIESSAGTVPMGSRQGEALSAIQEEEQNESQQVEMDLQPDGGSGAERIALQATLSASETQSSKARLASFDSTQASKKGTHGATPGKPDTDAAFLQALASTKKGKRREDDFDREFNNLRISKPEQDKDDEADRYRVLAEFEDEPNILGNFMVIMDYQLPLRDRRSRMRDQGTSKPEWQGQPDFKKFKKQSVARIHPPVELICEEADDFGTGPSYWKTPQSRSKSQNGVLGNGPLQPSQAANNGFMQSQSSNRAPQATKPRSKTQTQLRVEVAAQKVSNSRTRGRSKALSSVHEEDGSDNGLASGKESAISGENTQPLFLDDRDLDSVQSRPSGTAASRVVSRNVGADDDLILHDFDDDESEEGTLLSHPLPTPTAEKAAKLPQPSPAKKGKKRTAAAFVDDDADSGGMAFRGFGRSKRART